MIETRAVRSEELDAMLTLMCEAFALPFGPARDLFIKDPYFDIEKKRALFIDGRMVSCLTIVEAPIWISRAVVKVGGIAGVATRWNERRKGYAARLLVDSLSTIRALGCPFSALFPFSYDFYRRIGWERSGAQFNLRVRRTNLPRFAESRSVRQAHPADKELFANLYAKQSMHLSGRWIRDDKRWAYLFDHVKSRVIYRRGDAEGYALYEVRDETGNEVRLLELVVNSEEAWRGITGFFAERRGSGELSYLTSLDEPFARWLAEHADPEIESQPAVMFRITDIAAAISSLAPNFAEWIGGAALIMTDATGQSGTCRGAHLTGDGEAIRVTPILAGDRLLSSDHRIEGDVRAWTQVLTGHYSMKEALSLNHLKAFSPRTAAHVESLFPRRSIFVPPADHF